MATFQWTGFDGLMSQLGALAHPDPTDVLLEWQDIIEDDNRHGVLLGQDKDGVPMRPVKYRPIGAPSTQRVKARQRNNSGRRGIFAGLGPHAAGQHNNLTSAEYRKLGGPPLAPRGASSRVITNLVTEHGWDAGKNEWFAEGAWAEVVSTKGVPFLMAHFTGANTGRGGHTKLPVRDLRGVRPWGRQKAVAALQRWARNLLKGNG